MAARPKKTPLVRARILAIVFPSLSIEVVLRAHPELAGKKLALTEKRGGSLHVTAASKEARQEGVRVGSTHAHALAAAPGLLVREHGPEQDSGALKELARWASHEISPRVAIVAGRHAVLAEVGGTELVHGNEASLLARVLEELRAFGHSPRGAIADTQLAALALALAGPDPETIARPDETRAALAPLTIAALGFEEKVLDALGSVGVRSVGQLLRLPRKTLPSRFEEATLDRIERALGEKPDPLSAISFDEPACERLDLEGGTDRLEDLAVALGYLARKLASRLASQGMAARALELVFTREGGSTDFSCRLARPVSRAGTIEKILRERLERIDLSSPVTRIELASPETAKKVDRQGDLFLSRLTDGQGNDEELVSLLARLEARLGARKVLRSALAPDHRPERAFSSFPATSERATPRLFARGRRPTRLLARPSPLAVQVSEKGKPSSLALRGEPHPISCATGPERIETGFWDGHEARRDYWVVADQAGRESWVFRDIEKGAWFLHGVFD